MTTALPRAFMAVSAVLLVLLAFSVPFVERGTGAHVITLVSAGMLTTVFVGSAVLVYVDWDPFEEVI